jgi:hypothetical protein
MWDSLQHGRAKERDIVEIGSTHHDIFLKILVPSAEIFLKNLEQNSANRCQSLSTFITMQHLALDDWNIFKN